MKCNSLVTLANKYQGGNWALNEVRKISDNETRITFNVEIKTDS